MSEASPFSLETERLRLREFTAADATFIVKLLNSPGWLRYIGDRGVRTEADALNYIAQGPRASYARYGYGLWCVARKEDGVPVGMCGLLKRDALPDVEVGFAFLPEHAGLGYAQESARAVVEAGRRRFGLRRLAAITQPTNAASIRVLEKLGLTYERMATMPNGESLCYYSGDFT